MDSRSFDIAVIGNWHLAFVSAASLSALGHNVVLVNPKIDSLPFVEDWEKLPTIPVYEPNLDEIIKTQHASGYFSFANDLGESWSASVVWIAVDTPITENDEPIVEPLFRLASTIKKHVKTLKYMVVTSQVPLGFCSELEERLNIEVAYVPENLRLGKGLETFLKADRIVIGAKKKETRILIKESLNKIPAEFVLCDLETAEMSKHATNIFLATSISFANELARVGESFGVDSEAVAKALKLDKRIGQAAYVRPGLGFAGGTLPRDLRVIKKLGERTEVPTPLVNAVLSVNEDVYSAIAETTLKHLGEAQRVLILGYTYKAQTDTLRRSPAVQIARHLKSHGVTVDGYDPFANINELGELEGLVQNRIELTKATPRPDVILIMTAREQFKELPWTEMANWWRREPKGTPLIFDTQSLLSPETVIEFHFKPLWQPVLVRTEGRKANVEVSR